MANTTSAVTGGDGDRSGYAGETAAGRPAGASIGTQASRPGSASIGAPLRAQNCFAAVG